MRRAVLLSWLLVALNGAAAAQSPQPLLETYVRVTGILNDAPVYVGELLQNCAYAGVLTEGQAQARTRAYLQRNHAIIQRTDAWSKKTEAQLRSQGLERAAAERSYQSGLEAVNASTKRAREELTSGANIGALCRSRLDAIDAGTYDLDRNAELVAIVAKEPGGR